VEAVIKTKKMLYKTDTNAFRGKWIDYVYGLQDQICHALETIDGKAVFAADEWKREGGGGGLTKTIANGNVFEKGGVNVSSVWGKVSDKMRAQLGIAGYKWFACGLSLVIHPLNPYVPTVHANWRYFELYDEAGNVSDRWFGGGSDLTPYYLFEEDARHFHRGLRDAILPFGDGLYEQYKKCCDEYFVNSHRGQEMRGIGGVFYDHLRPGVNSAATNQAPPAEPVAGQPNMATDEADRLLSFQQACGDAFLSCYLPIVEKRKDTPYGQRELEWQEIRRGRYVEFNLIHDRGTLFGLRTKGRTESILMSLPPRARWAYDYRPAAGSPEAELLEACLHPRDWILS
jgi:coproporphyrinogen III oxidase